MSEKKEVDLTGYVCETSYCSKSIEEWAADLERAYISGNNRPNGFFLDLKRWGECYAGELYVLRDKDEKQEEPGKS
jgi:hypothetical protein